MFPMYSKDPYLDAVRLIMQPFPHEVYVPLPIRVEMNKRAPTPKPAKLKKKKRGY